MPNLAELLNGGADANEASVPEHILDAPLVVRRRIRALKKLQLEFVDAQTEFFQRVHELEIEARKQYDELNNKRRDIISGEYEPTDAECNAKLLYYIDDETNDKLNATAPAATGNTKGVPDFWLNVFKSICPDIITDGDADALRYLTDVTISQSNDPASFTLTFHFDSNPYFNNSKLTKYYKMMIGPNAMEEKLLYNGPSVVATEGCIIEWKDGKNLTQKLKKKKVHNRTVTKMIKNDSFFNFFTPAVTEISEDLSEDAADELNQDFELGQMLRESVVDTAVLYYTNEAEDDDDDDFGAGGEGDDQFEDDDE